mmetsp:Transcript_7080/g.16219  ORF Transcript_7080/g.16219 Transcript_7080/m.16219 type:complete len:83 (-) Transcript_7080:390-638(-)
MLELESACAALVTLLSLSSDRVHRVARGRSVTGGGLFRVLLLEEHLDDTSTRVDALDALESDLETMLDKNLLNFEYVIKDSL